MPEGDSVYRFAARLRTTLAGKPIVAARSHGPGPVPQVHRIVGATCTAVDTHGKNLFIHFDNGLALRGHLRMYGTWHFYKPGEKWLRSESQARLVLEVDGTVVVNFSAPVIELIDARAINLHRPIATLGPDLLAEDFDSAEALRRFRHPSRPGLPIGDAIMDQKVMAGVGNIWKHETLFRCGMYPWRLVRDLTDDELSQLIAKARELLRASVGKDVPPGMRARRPKMYTYMRAYEPCFRCTTRLQNSVQGNDLRNTAWCPKCQPRRAGDPEPGYRPPPFTATDLGD